MDVSRYSLDGKKLKMIGWIFTVLGALGITLFRDSTAGTVLVFLGRIALPVFAFLLVEGFLNTDNLERYFLSLAVSAVAAEPFYDYACQGSWLDFSSATGQNPLFAFVPGLIEVFFLHHAVTRGKTVPAVLMVIAAPLWGFVFNIHYGMILMALCGVFYLLHEKKTARSWVAAAVGAVPYLTPALGVLPTVLYNGERGKYPKYLFYALYPALWALLAVVRLLGA